MKSLLSRSFSLLVSSSINEFSKLLAGEMSEWSNTLGVSMRSFRSRIMRINAHQIGGEDGETIFELLSNILKIVLVNM